jgi:hypothetical protein
MGKGRLEAFGDGVTAIIITQIVFVAAALMWLIPDRRVENVLPRHGV